MAFHSRINKICELEQEMRSASVRELGHARGKESFWEPDRSISSRGGVPVFLLVLGQSPKTVRRFM
jgi:hypothetical protein